MFDEGKIPLKKSEKYDIRGFLDRSDIDEEDENFNFEKEFQNNFCKYLKQKNKIITNKAIKNFKGDKGRWLANEQSDYSKHMVW